ncbi:Glycerol-3-phosphate dehydrogenase [NAD(+)], cytoplasmic [Cucumispora dikerogammari]|nr:Glycerol-3-phosphate dehydrogenase [NAD(+)], cytoplasmic [Cucumispora dikerogammari]
MSATEKETQTTDTDSDTELIIDSNANIRMMNPTSNIGIIGSGAFGTSVAVNIAHKQKTDGTGNKVFLYVRQEYVLIRNNLVYNIDKKELCNLPAWYFEAWKTQHKIYTLPTKFKLSSILETNNEIGTQVILEDEKTKFVKNEWFTLNLCSFMNTLRFNPIYLKTIKFPSNVIPVCSMKSLIDCEGIIFSVPHQFLKDVVKKFKEVLLKNAELNSPNEITICENAHTKSYESQNKKTEILNTQIMSKTNPVIKSNAKKLFILNTTKGIIPGDIFPSKAFQQLNDLDISIKISVLMGANIAIQIASLLPAETCIAGAEESNAFFKDKFLMSVHTYDDSKIETFELFGALKNIIAFSVGLIDGLEIGTNGTSVIFRKTTVEMLKIISILTPMKELEIYKIFMSGAGLGDLFVTCREGRNYKKGYEITQEYKFEPITKEVEVETVQGPGTLKVLKDILVKNSEYENCWDELKVFKAVYNFLYDGASVSIVVDQIHVM